MATTDLNLPQTEAVSRELRHQEMEEFYSDLHRHSLDALWRREGSRPARADGEPVAPYLPWRWSWDVIRPFVERAGQLVEPGPESQRRALVLVNPGMPGVPGSTHTLSGAVQMVLPGEVAPSHRHTAAAIRFIIEGSCTVTVVNGEAVEMYPGDLVLTPGWFWHGHVNESDSPLIWMDTLDVGLVGALRQFLHEQWYPELLQPVSKLNGDSYARFGSAFLRPVGGPGASPISPLLTFPWAETERALHRLALREGDRFDDIAFDYTNPSTGGPVLPTIGCRIQLLRPGIHTHAHRHSSAGLFHVFRGRGATIVDGVEITWQQGDFFALPPYCWHEHVNSSAEEAILFSVTDAPVLAALNLYREDPFTANDGHQAVTSSLPANSMEV